MRSKLVNDYLLHPVENVSGANRVKWLLRVVHQHVQHRRNQPLVAVGGPRKYVEISLCKAIHTGSASIVVYTNDPSIRL